MEIVRIVEEEEKYLIKIRTVEEIVLRRFHKYLKRIWREHQQESYGIML